MKAKTILTLVAILALSTLSVNAQSDSRGVFGIRGGVGTDISGGLAYGVGGSYLVPVQKNYVELGAVIFGGSYSETSDNGFNEYEEETDLTVIGVMANFLFGFEPLQSKTYFVAGMGLASLSVTWEERSSTDVSLGTPLPGGGSMQSDEGSVGGTIFNLGVGHSFASGLDLRAETPVIVAFSTPGEATSVIPTFMVTAGYKFF